MAGGDVRAVELPGAAGPEVLARIGLRPQVEINDLRTVDGRQPHDLPSLHLERMARSDRYDHFAD